MPIDLESLVPTQNDWLPTRALYEGTARAEFTNPPGSIEGPATVSVNAAGRCSVRIKIEKIDAPDEKNFALASGPFVAPKAYCQQKGSETLLCAGSWLGQLLW